MATSTERFGFTLPSGQDPASIIPLNLNTQNIEKYLGMTQDMLAPLYDATEGTYEVDDIVTHDSVLYKCITAISTAEPFDSTKWTQTSIEQIIDGVKGDVSQLNSSLSQLDGLNVVKRITTPASVVSFSDGSNLPIYKLLSSIEPVQDLHGYDNPWVGGVGKNKLPMTVNEIKTNNMSISWDGNVGIKSGVTITLHTDDGISVSKISISGTPTNTIYFYVGAFNLKSGVSYVLNGCPSNKPDNDVLYVSNQPSGFGSWVDSGNGATYNATQDWNGISFYIRIWANVAQNNDWYPMIRLATETDSTFEPYSNICPISGHTEANDTISPTLSPQDGTTYNIDFLDGSTPITVYGGTLEAITGILAVTKGNIASYNGETLPATWISDRDVYVSGATPTTGAQVVYDLASPITYQLSTIQANSLNGNTNIWTDTGDILEVDYTAILNFS